MDVKYKPLLITLFLAIVFYSANKLLFLIPDYSGEYGSYHYPLEMLYLFFTICSLAIIFVLLRVHEKNSHNTGFAFLAATSVQMGLSYLMLRPILDTASENNQFEKINFFIIFILFLAIETIVIIRLLNKKQ